MGMKVASKKSETLVGTRRTVTVIIDFPFLPAMLDVLCHIRENHKMDPEQ